MSLAVRLRDLRTAKGESLQDVADAIKVSKTHIWELEKGKSTNPSADLLKRLADHFNVTIAQLVGEDIENSERNPELMRMFRQAGELDDRDREILDATLQSLLRSRKGN